MRRQWPVTATVAVLALLAACSDDPEPNIDPDPTPSVSTSAASASTSPPTSPTPEALGPEETVRAWVAAENEALQTGSTVGLESLAASECLGCENFARPIEAVYAAGGSYEGGAWTLVSEHLEGNKGSKAELSAAVHIAAGTTLPKANADPVSYDAQNHLMKFEMVMEGAEWKFSVIAFVS